MVSQFVLLLYQLFGMISPRRVWYGETQRSEK